MADLSLRDVPDEVVERLQRMAEAEATSVSEIAVRELTAATRWADNANLLATLPDFAISVSEIVADLDTARRGR